MRLPPVFLLFFLFQASALPAAVGDLAPTWQARNADGDTVDIVEELQEHPVMLVFWASWCPYCKALLPHLESIRQEYGDRIGILALNFRDDEDPEAFMRDGGYGFTLIPDGDAVAELHGVHGTPGLIILDQDRAIRFNLYDVPRNPPPEGEEQDSHGTKAARRAPYWAAKIRQAVDEVLANEGRQAP